MVNLTNHHRKTAGKIWDARPIAEVQSSEVAIVLVPARPKEDWKFAHFMLCGIGSGVPRVLERPYDHTVRDFL